jgi:hypothetical protein
MYYLFPAYLANIIILCDYCDIYGHIPCNGAIQGPPTKVKEMAQQTTIEICANFWGGEGGNPQIDYHHPDFGQVSLV